MAKQSLFHIGQDMLAFEDLLNDADANFDDPKVQEMLKTWGQEIMTNLENKVDVAVAFMQKLEYHIKIRKERAKAMQALAKVDENSLQRIKQYVKEVLEWHKVKKLDTPNYRVTIASNAGKQAVFCNVKPEDLPEDLQIKSETVKINNDEIRKRLEAGEKIGGCRLLPRGTSLRFK